MSMEKETTQEAQMITAARVAQIIYRYGVSAVFNTYASESYSETTGKVTRSGLTAHTVTVTPPNADGSIVKQFGPIDGVTDAALFSVVAAQGLTFEPAVGQEFVWDSRTWVVTWTSPVRGPSGVLAYQFGIKGKA